MPHIYPDPKAKREWKQQDVLQAEAPQGHGHGGRDTRAEEEGEVFYTFATRQPEMYNPARKAEPFPPVNQLSRLGGHS